MKSARWITACLSIATLWALCAPAFAEDILAPAATATTAKRSWGPEQATGAPDTPVAGDYSTAWASRTADGQQEWLELSFAQPIEVAAVMVYESYNPGALTKVTVFDQAGAEQEAWSGQDPTAKGAEKGVSVVPLRNRPTTSRIKLHIDSVAVSGWNEIDAVALVDVRGQTYWATGATASSSYADYSTVYPAPAPQEDLAARVARLEAQVAELQATIARLQAGSGNPIPKSTPYAP